MPLLKSILLGVVVWTVGFGGMVGYIFVNEKVRSETPVPEPVAENAAVRGENEELPSPLPETDTMVVDSTASTLTADEIAARNGDVEALKRLIESEARERKLMHRTGGAKPGTPARTETPAPRTARVSASGMRTQPEGAVNDAYGNVVRSGGDTQRSSGYRLVVPGAVDVPLIASSKNLGMIPDWRMEQGVYSGSELESWRNNGLVRFVPNGVSIDVLQRADGYAQVKMRGMEDVSGWVPSRYIRTPATGSSASRDH